MIPETTMGITKIARSPVLNRMRLVNPTASRKAMTLTMMTVVNAKGRVNV